MSEIDVLSQSEARLNTDLEIWRNKFFILLRNDPDCPDSHPLVLEAQYRISLTLAALHDLSMQHAFCLVAV